MKSASLLLVSLLCFSHSVHAQRTAWFRNLSIDDRFYELKLKDSIDPSIAPKTNVYQVTFDKLNRLVGIQYQAKGKNSVSEAGYSGIQINYSDSCEERRFSFPINSRYKKPSAVALEKIKLNQQGFPVEVSHYNDQGKPVRDGYGVVTYVRLLNNEGWNVEQYYMDENRNKTASLNGDYGFRYQWNSDDSCYIPTVHYVDQQGNLHSGKRGYAIVRSWFDKKARRLICSKYYNERDELTKGNKQYAYRVKSYYPNGLLQSVSYYNTRNKPCTNEDGFSRIEFQYNSLGNGILALMYSSYPHHFIEFSSVYNDQQQLIEQIRKKDGKELSEDSNGVAIFRYEYDASGNLKAKHSFNKKNVSVLRTEY